MHRLDDESTCGLEIPIGPILVSHHQHGYERYDQPARGEVFYVGDDTFSRHAADLSADKLNCDHERRRQKNRPQQAIPKLRPGLGISRDAGRIVVGGPRDQPGSEQTQQMRRFVELSLGGIHGSNFKYSLTNYKDVYTPKPIFFPFGGRRSACDARRPVTSVSVATERTSEKRYRYSPSRKCPKALSARNLSEMIFRIASIGTAKIAPSMPHIQNQNTSDRMINTGFSVKRRASSMGVSDSPSMR